MKEKLTDRELFKWCKILGSKKMMFLHVDGKIYLTSDQIDKVINMRRREYYTDGRGPKHEYKTYSRRPNGRVDYKNYKGRDRNRRYTIYEKKDEV